MEGQTLLALLLSEHLGPSDINLPKVAWRSASFYVIPLSYFAL